MASNKSNDKKTNSGSGDVLMNTRYCAAVGLVIANDFIRVIESVYEQQGILEDDFNMLLFRLRELDRCFGPDRVLERVIMYIKYARSSEDLEKTRRWLWEAYNTLYNIAYSTLSGYL